MSFDLELKAVAIAQAAKEYPNPPLGCNRAALT